MPTPQITKAFSCYFYILRSDNSERYEDTNRTKSHDRSHPHQAQAKHSDIILMLTAFSVRNRSHNNEDIARNLDAKHQKCADTIGKSLEMIIKVELIVIYLDTLARGHKEYDYHQSK